MRLVKTDEGNKIEKPKLTLRHEWKENIHTPLTTCLKKQV